MARKTKSPDETRRAPTPDLRRLDAALDALCGPGEARPARGSMTALLDAMLGRGRAPTAREKEEELDAMRDLVSRLLL